MTNPYRDLNDFCFWSKAVTEVAPGHIDPVVRSDRIEPHHQVATMGSCFAQHISRHIAASGLNYLVTEQAPEGMDPESARSRGYGVFTARYGNVYTVRQAVQLFDRAFGHFNPAETVWQRGERFVDAFRPQIEPLGFATPKEVQEAAVQHLEHVRDMFLRADWLVFTLGLTEAWRSKTDGAVYPIAPGVAGGNFSPDRHEFVNFTASEVRDDLIALANRISSVNPKSKIILTISPVPLIATYEKRHVLVSTAYSKAALRVAGQEAERILDNVIYFPSYEIITSPAAAGRYYSDDLRQITHYGVKHVMRIFGKHYFPSVEPHSYSLERKNAIEDICMMLAVRCDEEEINKINI